MLMRALDLAESSLLADSAETASSAFYEAMTQLGASYLQTRVYRRPIVPLTSAAHFAAGGVISRISPADWPGSAAFNYICFDCNPLLGAIRVGLTRYPFSDFAPDEALSVHMAGLMLTERLMTLAEPASVEEVRLTDRERDILGWVAEGKSDWEIAMILGLAESTVRFHVDNARKKLGAVNRAQAVARLAAARRL